MINTTRLRKAIGWSGMALPLVVLTLSLLYGFGFPDSISATYFVSTCIAPFMVTLGAAGILLITYEGYDKVDDILNILAGICGLCVCLFPCAGFECDATPMLIGTFQLPMALSNSIHTAAAIGFFGILAYNSLFQFTKGSDNPTENKKKRNVIFRICGIGMIASFALLALVSFGVIVIPHVIWVIEAIALAFFGVSWLTKANCYRVLFADKKN